MTDSNQTAPVGSTTGSGAPAASDRNSLSIGPDGLIAATEMLARFSTVAGESGSPDTWRDVRGFSLKFYTEGRQLRPRRQQHADILRARPDEVSPLHSQPEASGGQRSARQSHAMGFLDQQSGERAPGHLSDGRARPAAHLAADGRLWLAYVHVDQRRGREVLGQVSLPCQPGHGVLHQRRSRQDGGRGCGLPSPRSLRVDRCRPTRVVEAKRKTDHQ